MDFEKTIKKLQLINDKIEQLCESIETGKIIKEAGTEYIRIKNYLKEQKTMYGPVASAAGKNTEKINKFFVPTLNKAYQELTEKVSNKPSIEMLYCLYCAQDQIKDSLHQLSHDKEE